MTWPAAPLDVRTRLTIGSATVDASGQASGHVIRRGPGDGAPAPSSCWFELEAGDGKYNPRNRNSPYRGQLRDVPANTAVRLVTDEFSRTVAAGGLGTSDTGHAWTVFAGSAANGSVSGGSAIIAMPSTTAQAWRVVDVAVTDVDVRADFATSITDVSGATVGDGVTLGLMCRVSGADYTQARITIRTDEVMTLSLWRGATQLGFAVTIVGAYTPGAIIRVRLLAEGQTLRAKAWLSTATEPAAWTLTERDPVTRVAGSVGLRAAAVSGNTNAPWTATVPSMSAELPRFAGRVVDWPHDWPRGGAVAPVWARVEAVGPIEWLSRQDKPKSALRRAIEASGPAYYWPLDDGRDSSAGRAAIGAAEPMAGPVAGQWGQGTHAPWLERGVLMATRVKDATALVAPTSYIGGRIAAPRVGTWAMSAIFTATKTDATPGGSVIMMTGSATFFGDQVAHLSCTAGWLAASGTWSVYLDAPRLVEFIDPVPVPFMLDGRPHTVTVLVDPLTSSTMRARLYLDGVLRIDASFGQASEPPARPTLVDNVTDTPISQGTLAVGHVAVWIGAHPDPAALHAATRGHPSETAIARMARLCAEEGVAFTAQGDPTLAEIMGPQQVGTAWDSIEAAADAGQGLLHETRGIEGLHYVDRVALYNRAPLALTYGQLSDLRPTGERVVNDATVTRQDGGSAQHVRTTGVLGSAARGRQARAWTRLLERDERARAHAEWATHVGTTDLPSYTPITVDLLALASDTNPATQAANRAAWQALTGLDVGTRVTATGMPAWVDTPTLDQGVIGYTERLDAMNWSIEAQTRPAEPYTVGVLDDPALGVLDTDGSELAAAAAASAAGAVEQHEIAVTAGPTWVTDPAEFPKSVLWGPDEAAEQVTVTAIAASAITFVAAGVAVHADNATVVPGLPAGLAAGDLLLALIANRTTSAVPVAPSDWELLHDAGNVKVFGKITPPGQGVAGFGFTGSSAGATCSGQLAAFRGRFRDITKLVFELPNWAANVAAQNVAIPPDRVLHPEQLIIRWAWKQDDWTTASGPGTLIGSLPTTVGNDQGLWWSYEIQTAGAPIPAGTVTLTGGVSAISRAGVVPIRADKQLWTVTRGADGWTTAHQPGARVRVRNPLRLAL